MGVPTVSLDLSGAQPVDEVGVGQKRPAHGCRTDDTPVDEILQHADDLAARFKDYEPDPAQEFDPGAIALLPSVAVRAVGGIWWDLASALCFLTVYALAWRWLGPDPADREVWQRLFRKRTSA